MAIYSCGMAAVVFGFGSGSCSGKRCHCVHTVRSVTKVALSSIGATIALRVNHTLWSRPAGGPRGRRARSGSRRTCPGTLGRCLQSRPLVQSADQVATTAVLAEYKAPWVAPYGACMAHVVRRALHVARCMLHLS